MRLHLFVIPSLPFVLSVALVSAPFTNAQAQMIATGQAVSSLQFDANRRKVANFINRDDVKTQLVNHGVNTQEATQRLASLSDVEVQRLATEIDQSRAGGDTLLIGGILTTILLVLLIIYLAKRI